MVGMRTHSNENATAERQDSWVEGLMVSVERSNEQVLKDVNVRVSPGEIVGLAGETGSGKTTLALAFMRYSVPGLDIADGEIAVSGNVIREPGVVKKLSLAKQEELRRMRGCLVSYVPQDPGNALPSNMSIRDAFIGVMNAHDVKDRDVCQKRMRELFENVGLPCDEEFYSRYPHQLSGGQQQRVAIAIAFALNPGLVVMDEPTTGLDATTTRKVVDLIRRMSVEFKAGIVFVSHDLRLLLDLADRIAVIRYGEIVEVLPAATFVRDASHEYTKALIAALPKITFDNCNTVAPSQAGDEVLRVEGLSARYGSNVATHGVSFAIKRGSCLAFVGESGSGKTTTARCIAGIHEEYDGKILLNGVELPRALSKRSHQERKAIQYVFQNPTSALNPRKTVGRSVSAAVSSYRKCTGKEADAITRSLFEDVGLRADHMLALPHQLSGGQRQRVCLARALAAEPDLLVCDEVTSSLDVIVQEGIIALLKKMQAERNLAVLFITHDFGLALEMSDKAIVLLQGSVVESGVTRELVSAPQHPYTKSLVASATIEVSVSA